MYHFNRCLDLYEKDDFNIVKDVNRKSKIILEKCNIMKNNYSFIKDFRLNGLLGCFEFNLTEDQITRLTTILLLNNIFCMRLRKNIFIAPPLTINDNLLVHTLNSMDKGFNYFKANQHITFE